MKTVVIDKGHGGKDPGASGGGMLEKNVNRNVGNKLEEYLMADGYKTVQTRKNDEYVDLTARCRIANAAKGDAFLSLHENSGGKGIADGFEIIYQCDPKYMVESKRLAECLATELQQWNNQRRIFCRPSTVTPNEDYHTVLAGVNMPGVIIEGAFMDNPNDVKAIATYTGQYELANRIRAGVNRYFGRG